MKYFAFACAVGALFSAVPAQAVTFTVGAIDSGLVDMSSSYKSGYTLIDFNNGTSPFTGGGVEYSTVANQYVEPTGDTTPYFSVGASTSSPATLSLTGINQLSFYWGSIDTYNSITFDGLNQSFSGTAFGGSDSLIYRPSREVTFNFTASEAAALTGISLRSTNNAFELDNLIYGSAAPEPGSWAMMIVGFGSIGFLLRRRKDDAARIRYLA